MFRILAYSEAEVYSEHCYIQNPGVFRTKAMALKIMQKQCKIHFALFSNSENQGLSETGPNNVELPFIIRKREQPAPKNR